MEKQPENTRVVPTDITHVNNVVPLPEQKAVNEVKRRKKSSALRAASQWRSAVGHARAHSHDDIEGKSKLTNTGPFIDYDDV